MSRARAAFLAQQWEAACVETRDTFVGSRLRHGVSLEELAELASRTVSRRVWQRFVDQLRLGHITACEHLTGAAPARVFWVSEHPTTLMCQLCAIAWRSTLSAEKLNPTSDCAACGTPTDRPATLTLVVGSVGISAQICPACRRPDRQP